MDITNENFEANYDDLLKKLNECDFMSVDCELSGITSYKILNYLDTPKIRYEKMKNTDADFLIIQFGLCFFKKTDTRKYQTDAYNFYVFPRSEKSKFTKPLTFTCLNTSIEFLIQNNFDFNKLFKNGISFISKLEEEKLRFNMNNSSNSNGNNNNNNNNPNDSAMETSDDILIPSKSNDFKDKLVQFMAEVDEFFSKEEEKVKQMTYAELPFVFRIYMEKNLKRKYQYKYKFEFKQQENKEFLITITKKDPNEIETDEDILNREIGLAKLIWEISRSSKLVIGHNMITDIMQIVRMFFYPQLPDSLDEFKRITHSIFPKLLDTKHLASLSPLKEFINITALGDMFKILSTKEPFSSIEIVNCKYNSENEKLHEAGYDAFLTGCCFLYMSNYLQSLNQNSTSILDPYINKLHLMKSNDITFLDLCNDQPEPNRDNVLYIEINKKVDTKYVFDIFSDFGQVFVSWIDDFSAFVQLKEEKNFKKAVAHLVGVPGNDYKIFFYKTYLNKMKEQNSKANGGFEIVKRKQTDYKDLDDSMSKADAKVTPLKKLKNSNNGNDSFSSAPVSTPDNGKNVSEMNKPFSQNEEW